MESFSDLMKIAIAAERDGNYQKVLEYYDRALEIRPNSLDALMGKAFAKLTILHDGEIQYFAFQSEYARLVKEYENEPNRLNVHTWILDKAVSISLELGKTVIDLYFKSNEYDKSFKFMNNLTRIKNIFDCVSATVDSEKMTEVSKFYIDVYRKLKTSIIAHYDLLITAKKAGNVSPTKDEIKDFKLSKIKAKKALKLFNKCHK